MQGDIDSVNHVGIAVHDLAVVSALYERLGFTLSPLSMHKGALKPGEPEQAFGTGNRCAVFPNNYLEILAWVDRDKFDFGVRKFLERHEGAHIICFGCGNAQVVNDRVRASGIATSGVIPLQRDVPTLDGDRTAKFECVHFGEGWMPEGLIQAAHHVTPQYIHQERYIRHANAVTALSDVYVADTNVGAVVERYRKLTGREPERVGRRQVFRLPLVSRVSILHPDDLAAEFPGSTFPQAPSLIGYAFASNDLATTERCVRDAGLTYHKEPQRLVVPAREMFGATVVFEAA